MSEHNGLSAATEERLYILAEECGEVVQMCSKILRHGFDHKRNGMSNKELLEMELGDIEFWTTRLIKAEEISEKGIDAGYHRKLSRYKTHTNYQE